MNYMRKYLKLASSVVICLVVGSLGSFFTAPAIPTWYEGLTKPFFNPPNWIFAPMWTILYILMGISFYLIWIKHPKDKRAIGALKLFGIQLAVNAIWSPIFFGMKNLFLALITIVLMWILIKKTILAFMPIDKKAAKLLYPYIAWVSFATVLNFSVWILNR